MSLGNEILDDGNAFRNFTDDDEQEISMLKVRLMRNQAHFKSGLNAVAVLLFLFFASVVVGSVIKTNDIDFLIDGLIQTAIVAFLLYFSTHYPKTTLILIVLLFLLYITLTLNSMLALINTSKLLFILASIFQFAFIYFFVRAIFAGYAVDKIKREIRNTDEAQALEL